MIITANIDAANEFLDTADQAVAIVSVPRNPDPRVERYSGTPATPFAAKTPAEIVAYDAAKQTGVVTTQFRRELQALAAALYKDAHGAFPNATQNAQLKADFVTARKALG